MAEHLLSDAQRKDFRKEKMMNANFDELEKKKLSRTELKEQRINELFDSCRESVLQQIIGPFGLTPAMFNDKAGGNVTTQHNAEKDIFAKESEEFDRTDYDYSAAKSQKMQDAVKDGSMNSQEFVDQYTGKKEPTKRIGSNGKIVMNAELDHLVPVKDIHRQGGWMKNKDGRKGLSSEADNLHYTTHKTNRSKSDKTPEDALSEENGFDKERIKPLIEKAQNAIDEKLPTTSERLQYHGKELLSTGASEAGKNALRQATGLLLHELVSGTYIEIKRIAKEPTLQDEFIEHVIEALKKVAERIQSKFDHIFNSIVSGGVQGFVSNFLTFLINNLVTTSAKVVTIIRESMKGLWEAIKLVINPPEGKNPLDVAREATKIIAGVVTMGLGLIFEKSVEAFILSIPLLAPMASVIAPAATAILTGIATALVIYGIDRFFDWLSRTGAELLNAQVENMEAAAEMIERMAQFIQGQFDNSRQYQLCIEQYRKIEFELTTSQRNMHSALDYAENSLKSKESFEERLGVVKQLNNELADIEGLLRAYEKK